MRLGEPTKGTFGTTYYDGIKDNVDEIRSILNQAQEHVTWMCYSANQSLLEKTIFIEVLSGVTRYTLPDDFLGPVSVFHRTYSQEYELERRNLFEVRASTRTERYDYRFRYYEIRENVPLISARGVITRNSPNRIVDDELGSVRLGDTAYNLTDGSQARIEAVYPGLGSVQVDQLSGGETNRFQKGDQYQIDMKEATRDAIDFWPTVTREDSRSIHSGAPSDWTLTEDGVVFHITANFSAVPTGMEADERVILNLYEGDGESVTSELISQGSREGLVPGANKFDFPRNVQLREDMTYSVRAFRADADIEVFPSTIDVTARDNPESVELRIAHLPRPMEKDSDYCEMPSWALNAVYAYGHIIAQKKQSRNPNADRGLLMELKDEIAQVKSFMFKRDERGPHSVPTATGSRAHGNWPYPSNWGLSALDITDLF